MTADNPLILAINPGGTSTKVAVYRGQEPVFATTVAHPWEELQEFEGIWDQFDYRKRVVLDTLDRQGISLKSLQAVVGRGGLVKPIPGGTYLVDEEMLCDLREGVSGHHPCNLAGALAYDLAQELGIPAFIVDPPIVDELDPVARISGFPPIPRRSVFHALNHKAVGFKVAGELGKTYQEANFIVVHGGSGISIGAHRKGQVVDVNNALDGEGPYSPERAGTLPVQGVLDLAFSGKFSEGEFLTRLRRRGGWVAYLGTNDGRKIEGRIEEGDGKAAFYFDTMCYQVAKEIGRMAAVLSGQVDAIILTGGLAYSSRFVRLIREKVEWIAPIVVKPGENEMESLALGALRALKGEVEIKQYQHLS